MRSTLARKMKIMKDEWGAYAPPKTTFLLRLITQLGFSRGRVRRAIARQWKKTRIKFVDIERYGIRFRLNIHQNTTDEKLLTSSKTYDGPELDALASLSNAENSTFIDVGANTGYYSLSMLKRGFSRILAIEPNPPTLERLAFNVESNDAKGKITIAPYCAGDAGEIPFYSCAGLGSASAITHSKESPSSFVQAMPLLKILRHYDVQKIDSLKIDVEGFEAKVLLPFFEEAPRELLPRIIVIEDCHQDDWGVDLISIIKGIGYDIERKTRGNLIMRLG